MPNTALSAETSPSDRPWIDISIPVHSGMIHWPSDPAAEVERFVSIDDGEICNVSRMSMCVHTGTHMDAPLHYLNDGMGIDQMPPDVTCGPARIIGINDPVAVTHEELELHDLRRGERILFRTGNSDRLSYAPPFAEDFIYVSPEAALYLAERGVRMVGVDYLSVGGYKSGNTETHMALLSAGIWIIEGLDLKHVRPGPVELLCLPLRIENADGAPARAFVRMV